MINTKGGKIRRGECGCTISKTSPWARGLVNKRYYKKGDEMNFEPMLDYKYSNIASGATPIGSAERAPDRG
jgi:hypothetical protein